MCLNSKRGMCLIIPTLWATMHIPKVEKEETEEWMKYLILLLYYI